MSFPWNFYFPFHIFVFTKFDRRVAFCGSWIIQTLLFGRLVIKSETLGWAWTRFIPTKKKMLKNELIFSWVAGFMGFKIIVWPTPVFSIKNLAKGLTVHHLEMDLIEEEKPLMSYLPAILLLSYWFCRKWNCIVRTYVLCLTFLPHVKAIGLCAGMIAMSIWCSSLWFVWPKCFVALRMFRSGCLPVCSNLLCAGDTLQFSTWNRMP